MKVEPCKRRDRNQLSEELLVSFLAMTSVSYEEWEAVTDDNDNHCCDCEGPNAILNDLKTGQNIFQLNRAWCTYSSENHVDHIGVAGEQVKNAVKPVRFSERGEPVE